MSKQKQKSPEVLLLQITGLDLTIMLDKFIKEKLGDITVNYIELTRDKTDQHVINEEMNILNVYLEYKRK